MTHIEVCIEFVEIRIKSEADNKNIDQKISVEKK